jgi:hypothetical protein
MFDDITESDWRVFKRLRESALERHCETILSEVARVIDGNGESMHERYLAVYRLIQECDQELESIFDTVRRSTAVAQLLNFRRAHLVTNEQFAKLSPELRDRIDALLKLQ